MVVMVIFIITGVAFIIIKYDNPGPLALSLSSSPAYTAEIYIGGRVAVPGWYPLFPGDTIDELITAAGGYTDDGNPPLFELSLSAGDNLAQRVNINTADAWLLCALPGIGEARAQAIIDYRMAHGRFRDIDELLKVKDIGPALLENIRSLVTVSE